MNSRFAVAVHILTLLAGAGDEPLTSEHIAGSVNTNASLIRRLLSMLARAGLTRAQHGTGGGALLARPAESITLRDVYRAVDEGELFALHRERPNPACPVGRNIQAALEMRIASATRAMEDDLDRTTIAEMAFDISTRDRGDASAEHAA